MEFGNTHESWRLNHIPFSRDELFFEMLLGDSLSIDSFEPASEWMGWAKGLISILLALDVSLAAFLTIRQRRNQRWA